MPGLAGFLAIAPAFALAVLAGVIGIATPIGMAAAGGAVVALAAAVAVGGRAQPRGLDAIASRFLLRALRVTGIEQVATEQAQHGPGRHDDGDQRAVVGDDAPVRVADGFQRRDLATHRP